MNITPGILLLVEDSETCVTTLEMALRGIGALETRTARTGVEALDILAHSPVRAIVTDLQLPAFHGADMDGFRLIEYVRTRACQATLPILVTSGDSDPGNSERLKRLGANAYFVKPYSPSALRRTLEQLLHDV
jgi:CheY-like chemotaxis protein